MSPDLGNAIARAHNLWTWLWPVIKTLTAWVALIVGLWSVSAPGASQLGENGITYMVLAANGAVMVMLGFKV